MRHPLLTAVVAVIAVLAFPSMSTAQSPVIMQAQPPRTVSVSGEGIMKVEPDMATVRFGVVTIHEDPGTASRTNAEAAARAMNAVRALGIPERKIRLESLMLQPHREYNPQTNVWKDLGYQASREVVVEVEDLDKLPGLIAQVVQKGANRLNGIQYDRKDRDAVKNEALRTALLAARAKAGLMATTLGAELGKVLQVSESVYDFPRPVMSMRAEAASFAKDESAQPDAYAAGEMEVRVIVQVSFELN